MAGLNLHDAALVIFRRNGLQILEHPELFLSAVLDLSDVDSLEIRTLKQHYGTEVTLPFAEAAAIGTPSACSDAAGQVHDYLHDTCGVPADTALSITSQISLAINEILGVDIHTEQEDNDVFDLLSDWNNEADYSELPLADIDDDYDDELEDKGDRPTSRIPLWASVPISVAAALAAIVSIAILAGIFHMLMRPTIHFDGGGATSGKMEAVRVDIGETYTLPPCTYELPEYKFAGWQNLSTGELLDAGTELQAYSSEIYVARWASLNYADLLEVKRFNLYIDNAGAAAFVVLENKSDVSLDVSARFTFTDVNGTSLEHGSDNTISVPIDQVFVLGTIRKDPKLSATNESFYSLEAEASGNS